MLRLPMFTYRPPSVPTKSNETGRTSGKPAATDKPIDKAPPLGTQSVHRAVTVLREIAAHGLKGLRLSDIADALSLERPTAHRIVKGLVAQGMLMQDRQTRHYHLGHVVYELGLAASPHFSLRELCQPTLQALAEKSGDSVFLMVRSGLDAVCIDLLEGGYPIQTRTLEIGGRRPLGVGAGSLALLMSLPQDERQRVMATNAGRLGAFGNVTEASLQKAIDTSLAIGYALNEEDVLPGVSAIGMAIRPRQGQPYAAISIAAIESRLSGARRAEMAKLLQKEVRALEKKLDVESQTWE
ncbi:helix-turn-helix domain-containing protein [Pandoraea fibrosis]|uniref:Helix-turn-helix domain-containing protein n=1 Tax=Pandoraea fibrosis TaxID=1891094 RepID=A0A5E4S2H4_9BURK|nr:helix-turn-helix domain-containing protein [Pandoraea fibrosis]QHF13880.1 helix-turn-helix domain-containing protein [Pandoraea fibrosis]VVD69790.1 IclR family transcriptional regulator [Pandoraea fibrosis]